MLFKPSIFLSLVAAVLADHTFTLSAGDLGDVTSLDSKLTIGNGEAPTLILREPSGLVNVQGTDNYLQLSATGVNLTPQADASSNFQILEGQVFAHGPSSDNAVWFACPAETGFVIQIFQAGNCQKITLTAVEETSDATEGTTVETTSDATEGTTVETTEEPTEESTVETTEESTVETTEEPTVETTEEPTEESTVETTEEPTKESTVETTEESTAEPTEEPTEQPSPEVTTAEGAAASLVASAGSVVLAIAALFL